MQVEICYLRTIRQFYNSEHPLAKKSQASAAEFSRYLHEFRQSVVKKLPVTFAKIAAMGIVASIDNPVFKTAALANGFVSAKETLILNFAFSACELFFNI